MGCISWQEVVGLLCSALQAEQVVDVAHCSWLDLVVMPIFAATLADQHLLHTAPQLLMVREETTVQDVHLVALLHLHPDPALVSCQCILFGTRIFPSLSFTRSWKKNLEQNMQKLVLPCK